MRSRKCTKPATSSRNDFEPHRAACACAAVNSRRLALLDLTRSVMDGYITAWVVRMLLVCSGVTVVVGGRGMSGKEPSLPTGVAVRD
jgi:hypothetical protein